MFPQSPWEHDNPGTMESTHQEGEIRNSKIKGHQKGLSMDPLGRDDCAAWFPRRSDKFSTRDSYTQKQTNGICVQFYSTYMMY
mmetsp:Transcript_26393/g.72557  ORF Transcript_26393/g.72557 Transcript_26393/m.72557 type:complete len:83 (+) Transcript_26393:176-424(+)